VGLPARASDDDRAAASVRLRNALLDGRLALPEFEQRVELALRSRTVHELDELVSDLPVRTEVVPPLASWSRRSLALAIDHALLLPLLLLIGLVSVPAAVLATPVLALGYFTLAHGGRSGRSVGERACGIAVRSDPHRSGVARRATYGQAFGRAVMLYVFGGLSFMGVGAINFLWPLWDVKRQAWHDKVAGTIVVRADALDLDRGRWLRRLRRWLRGPGSRGTAQLFENRLPFPRVPPA
jgi:uncharacterized RDD family membrane protein YckC